MVTKLGDNTELSIPAPYMKELRLLYCTVPDNTSIETLKGVADATKPTDDDSEYFNRILSVAADPDMDFCRASSLGADSTEYVLGKGWLTVFRAFLSSPLTSTTGTGQLCDRVTSKINTLLFDFDFPKKIKNKIEKEHKKFLEEDAQKDPKDRAWTGEKEVEFQKRLNACVETITPHITSASDDPDVVWGLQKYPKLDGETVYEDAREFCLDTYVMGRGGKPDDPSENADSDELPWYLKQQGKQVGPFENHFVAGLNNIPWPVWVKAQDFCTPVSMTEMIMSPVRYAAYVATGWAGWLGRRGLEAVVVGAVRLLYKALSIPLGGVKSFVLDVLDKLINRRPPPGGATPTADATPPAPKEQPAAKPAGKKAGTPKPSEMSSDPESWFEKLKGFDIEPNLPSINIDSEAATKLGLAAGAAAVVGAALVFAGKGVVKVAPGWLKLAGVGLIAAGGLMAVPSGSSASTKNSTSNEFCYIKTPDRCYRSREQYFDEPLEPITKILSAFSSEAQ